MSKKYRLKGNMVEAEIINTHGLSLWDVCKNGVGFQFDDEQFNRLFEPVPEEQAPVDVRKIILKALKKFQDNNLNVCFGGGIAELTTMIADALEGKK